MGCSVTHDECTALLGGWERFQLIEVRRVEARDSSERPQVQLELVPGGDEAVCSGCGQVVVGPAHDISRRPIRDLPILDAETVLVVHLRRVLCPDCGPKVEALPWVERYGRVTVRLAESVARLCAVLPIKHVAAHYGLHWEQVKNIDKAYLQRTLGPPDLSGLRELVIDEFSIRKGHRYATVIAEPATRRVLWVCEGSSRKAIRPFFNQLGDDGCEQIQAVAMDMNTAFDLEVQKHCANASVVYDLFHVIAKYGREVIDRVRVDEANRLRDDKPARKVVKSAKWLLLRNRENVNDHDQVRLDELLAANQNLMTVYVLKEDLKHIWNARTEHAARRRFNAFQRRAAESGIAALQKFARRLLPYAHGIIAHANYPLHTSVIEGINNKIKVIKRMAYGYRDTDYFFLKIRAAFPGKP
jgi:transposase